tara:strand:- start:131 stop:394 length:264 start_codon:yes stop_codon:yes gene_type:complete
MKNFVFLCGLFLIAGCVNKIEEPNYLGTTPVYVILDGQTYEIPPRPPNIYVPSAPSSSLVIPAQPNFIPVMPEESRKRLEILLTKGE